MKGINDLKGPSFSREVMPSQRIWLSSLNEYIEIIYLVLATHFVAVLDAQKDSQRIACCR